MAVSHSQIYGDYAKAFDQVGFRGTLLINTGDDVWTEYPNVRMLFRKTTPYDLIEPVYQDSTVLMILAADMPAGVDTLTRKDRVKDSNGKELTFNKIDWNKRRVNNETFAIECLVMG